MNKSINKILNRIVGHGTEIIDNILFNPKNWRYHPKYQAEALTGVLEQVGMVQTVIINQRTGNLVDGHLRCQIYAREGEMEIPVTYVDISQEEEDLVLTTFDPIGAHAAADKEKLLELLEGLETEDKRIKEFFEVMKEEEALIDYLGIDKDSKPNKRNIPLDFILTVGNTHPHVLLAKASGIKWGFQSNKSSLRDNWPIQVEPTFIDNDYFNYDHNLHLAVVKKFKPKYATARDIMSRAQCEIEGIDYHPLEKILDWAEELDEYAENIILIPKYDCLDQIPEKYILGYSVPTSHGRTPLPIKAFKGRRTHLLGGSWRLQLAHMAVLGDDIVSADNNYEFKIAKYGQFVTPEGETRTLSNFIGYKVSNPLGTALAISIASIGTKLKELYENAEIHGVTEVPLEAFEGRRIHLLGGDYKSQLDIIEQLGDGVMSVNNSDINRIALFGEYVTPEGEVRKLEDTFDFEITSPEGIAMALSFGAIGEKLNELMAKEEDQ